MTRQHRSNQALTPSALWYAVNDRLWSNVCAAGQQELQRQGESSGLFFGCSVT
jgi:hypothetical protein